MNSVWQKRSNAARLRIYFKVGAWDDASHIYEKIIRPGDDALKDVAPPLFGVLEALFTEYGLGAVSRPRFR